jgi:vacuolar-type H+-ATPase subunit I/STV1
MAETIGVVSATLEFTKIVLEVKHLYSSVKHAPQNLKHLLKELEALEEILETLKEQEANFSAYAPPDVIRKCRLQSEKAVQSLKSICQELLTHVKRSRIRGSVKVVLKKDALDKARQVVERAKVDLVLAHTTAVKWVVEQETALSLCADRGTVLRAG